ncbi:hypothetical protein E2C01_100296 [Portunus trituberculatus]|uniref:Uncharacterized protein n=1 Tax=Portunus trituberculatus TaxID=210409 RepID=A0A5B7KBN6_PORTR|nr:hypothetical protein [Portunus trituberculatus]
MEMHNSQENVVRRGVVPTRWLERHLIYYLPED